MWSERVAISEKNGSRFSQVCLRNINQLRADRSFHIKLKHVLGGISLLSLLASFEVFSIPAGSGIIDFLDLARISAALVWLGTALFSGGSAVVLHEAEN